MSGTMQGRIRCAYKVTVLGDYEGQGKTDYEEGTFKVIAIDNGEPGIGVDVMHIWLDGSVGPDYHNVGKLLGGSIQDH